MGDVVSASEGAQAKLADEAVVVASHFGMLATRLGITITEGWDEQLPGVVGKDRDVELVTVGFDTDGQWWTSEILRTAVDHGLPLVMTVGPNDAHYMKVLQDHPTGRAIAIVWHPEDELPDFPAGVTVIRSGEIREKLPAAVAAARLRQLQVRDAK